MYFEPECNPYTDYSVETFRQNELEEDKQMLFLLMSVEPTLLYFPHSVKVRIIKYSGIHIDQAVRLETGAYMFESFRVFYVFKDTEK